MYSASEFERIKAGLIPREMEDQWFMFFEAPWLFIHRSWTGYGIDGVRLEPSSEGMAVAESWVSRNNEQHGHTRTDDDQTLLTFLIDALLEEGRRLFASDQCGRDRRASGVCDTGRRGWPPPGVRHRVDRRLAIRSRLPFDLPALRPGSQHRWCPPRQVFRVRRSVIGARALAISLFRSEDQDTWIADRMYLREDRDHFLCRSGDMSGR